MRWTLCLLLAGCYDFSLFDHLPDAATSAHDLSSHDLSSPKSDLAHASDLLDEPFDEAAVDWSRWMTSVDESAFAIDTSVKHAGTGALRIDRDGISAAQSSRTLTWTTQLPSTPISYHLRYWLRIDTAANGNIDVSSFDRPSSEDTYGIAVTLDGNGGPPNGAFVLNDYGPTHMFSASNAVTLAPATWTCVEAALELVAGSTDAWNARLWVGGSEVGDISPVRYSATVPMRKVSIGFNNGTAQSTTNSVWIDSVLLAEGTSLIGCAD